MSSIATAVECCRVCRSVQLHQLIDFGAFALTGVFLDDGKLAPRASLRLVQCNSCKLVQLGESYDQSALYGNSYGYESHLNPSMIQHLQQKARVLEARFLTSISESVAVDIASNDGTFLSGYKSSKITKVGIDPLINIVGDYYPKSAIKVPSFFSKQVYSDLGIGKANLVTSLSVIYDLNNPVEFAQEVNDVLADDGIWHFEQSYLPLMLQTNSYDTICHEHLLYLSLSDIQNILTKSQFQIIDASINNINGGSIAVTAIKTKGKIKTSPYVSHLLKFEKESGILDGSEVSSFANNYTKHTSDLKALLSNYKDMGYRIVGVGASTKGNVLLQAAGINHDLISEIGEVNTRKFGKQTPGSAIPIVSEGETLSINPSNTIALVLPWHFKENLVPKLEDFLCHGGKLLFPLPQIEMISA